jgi:hypothetical protein
MRTFLQLQLAAVKPSGLAEALATKAPLRYFAMPLSRGNLRLVLSGMVKSGVHPSGAQRKNWSVRRYGFSVRSWTGVHFQFWRSGIRGLRYLPWIRLTLSSIHLGPHVDVLSPRL